MNAPARIVAVTVTTALWLLASATVATADSPVGSAWPEEEKRSTLEGLLFFGGGTLGLIVLVTLFALLTARRNYVPPPPGTDLERAPGTDAVHEDNVAGPG